MEEKNNLKFPVKLWALTNTPCETITWSQNGTSILIDLKSIEDYLQSENSLFKIKTISSFNNQLQIHGFEQISSTDSMEEYRHEFFQENCSELLPQIVRKSAPHPLIQQRNEIKRLDPCRRLIPINSLMYKARLNLRNELVFNTIGNILRQNIPIVEVPEEYFDNPDESIPNYSQHVGLHGFFGDHVTNEQLKSFFTESIVEPVLVPELIDPEPILIQSNEFMLPCETIKIDDEIEAMDVSENFDCDENESSVAVSNLFTQIRESIDVLNE